MAESYFDGVYYMYESACKVISKQGMQSQFKSRCEKIIQHCDVGYELFEMIHIFDQYFP